jgi:hypothetical protein
MHNGLKRLMCDLRLGDDRFEACDPLFKVFNGLVRFRNSRSFSPLLRLNMVIKAS